MPKAWKTYGARLGVDVGGLVKLYRQCLKVGDKNFASRVVAEAIASESTALTNLSAEATSVINADAVERIAKTR